MFLEKTGHPRNQFLSKGFLEYTGLSPLEKLKFLDKIIREKLPRRVLDAIWDFCVEKHQELYEWSDYWFFMEHFLEGHPEYVSQFLDRTDQWFSLKPSDDYGDTDKASEFQIFQTYDYLLTRNIIPEERKKEVYFLLIEHDFKKLHASDDQLVWQIASLETLTTEEIEHRMIADYIHRKLSVDSDTSLVLLDSLGKYFLESLSQKHSADEIVDLFIAILPPELTQNLNLTRLLLKVAVDHSEEDAKKLLSYYQDNNHWPRDDINNDKLWPFVWDHILPIFGFYYDPNAFYPENAFEVLMARVPNLLQELKMNSLLQEYYSTNHPYAALFNLPEDLRPTGKDLGYVCIDYFHNPRTNPHRDKKKVVVFRDKKAIWVPDDGSSHGLGVSTLAVGDRFFTSCNSCWGA